MEVGIHLKDFLDLLAMKSENAALSRIARLEEEIAKKKAEIIHVKGRLSEKERRARIRRLIEHGELLELAGLSATDSGALLGALLEVKKRLQDETKLHTLKATGDRLLKEKAAGKAITKER